MIYARLIALISLVFYAIPAHTQEYEFYIPGTYGWTKTPYNAVKGQQLIIAATGSVSHSFMSGFHGPQGNSNAFCRDCRMVAHCNVAGLIMRIGNGRAFCVDPILRGSAPASGPIYFAINDAPLHDNSGGFRIILSGPGVTIGGSTFD